MPARAGTRSAGVILAAGSARRMGRPKQLLPLHGRPLLEHVVAEACGSTLDEVVVVLGANAQIVGGGVVLGRATVILNPEHGAGMSTSLRAGVRALGAGVGRAVVILGDQPGVSAALIDELLDLQERSARPAAALSYDGLLHPPVVLDRRLWAGLEQLEGDVGCRQLIRARPDQVAALAMTGQDRHPVDIDTPEDYERLIGAR